MIEGLPAPHHVAAFRGEGTLAAAEYDTIINEIESKLQSGGHVNIYLNAAELEEITAETLKKDVKYILSKMGELHRFARMAIVTDKEWMEAAIALADSMLPETEIRTYKPGQQGEAQKWVAGEEEPDL